MLLPLPPRPSSSLLLDLVVLPIEADICICCMVRCERTRPLLLLLVLPPVALRSLEVLAAPELFLRLLDWEAGGMEGRSGRSGRSERPSNSKPSSSEEEAAKAEEEDASVSADAEAAVRLRLLQEEVLDEEEEEDDRAASPSSSIIVVMCYRCCSIMYCGGMAFWRAREGGVTAENDAKFDLGPSSSQLLWPSGRSACPTGAGVTHPSELILPAHMEIYDVAKKAVREKRLVWPSSEIVWSGRHPPTASAHRHKMCWLEKTMRRYRKLLFASGS